MITVKIEVNGNVIYCRSAINISEGNIPDDEYNTYKNDDGKLIKHKPEKGAISLAKKMLDTIYEM